MYKFLTLAAALALTRLADAQPLTTAFVFQGQLNNGVAPATGTYDLRFALFDAATGGTQIGPTLCSDNLVVGAGLVSAQLDFGVQFSGEQRFLEVWVRSDTGLSCSNNTGFTVLEPRQSLTAAPNAIFSLNAAAATTAANASQLDGQPGSFYTNAANLTGSLSPTSLSGSYSNAVTLSNVSNVFSGSGAGLTSLNASNVGAGTLADARLSSNVPRLNAANAFGNFPNSFLGYVGFGTTTPAFPLHVASTFAVLGLQDIGPDSTQAGYVSYRNHTGTETAWVGYGSAGSPDFSIVNARSGGNILLTPFSGNVGIGTSVPASKLEVRGDIRLGTAGNFYALKAEAPDRTIRGLVNTVGSVGAGTGFSVSHTVTGTYVINFNTAFSSPPTCVATSIAQARKVHVIQTQTTFATVGSTDVSNTFMDGGFQFIVMGN